MVDQRIFIMHACLCMWHCRLHVFLSQLPLTHLSRICSRFILRESGSPRYLHSAVLLSGTLLFFGGNTHNDTSLSNGAKCFSADFLAYDIGRTLVFKRPPVVFSAAWIMCVVSGLGYLQKCTALIFKSTNKMVSDMCSRVFLSLWWVEGPA